MAAGGRAPAPLSVSLRAHFNVGLLGFALMYGVTLPGLFQWAVRQSAAVEGRRPPPPPVPKPSGLQSGTCAVTSLACDMGAEKSGCLEATLMVSVERILGYCAARVGVQARWAGRVR